MWIKDIIYDALAFILLTILIGGLMMGIVHLLLCL